MIVKVCTLEESEQGTKAAGGAVPTTYLESSCGNFGN